MVDKQKSIAIDGYTKFMVKSGESQIKERPAPPAPINVKPAAAPAPVASVAPTAPEKE